MSHWHEEPGRVRHVYRRLHSGWVGAACLGTGNLESRPDAQIIFPGSFNPFHQGHRRMAELAQLQLGRPVSFELSLVNVDKPNLSEDAVWERCRQFSTGDTLWLTRAATFAEKARLFPRSWFVIGIDTLQRIVDPSYYGGEIPQRDRSLRALMKRQSQFLVFGRAYQGQFLTLSDVELPDDFASYCRGVSESDFRDDISSRAIRAEKDAT
ncbi:MAG: hypothetical protein U0795_18410 [Pirellulales bacterium]